MTQSDGQPALPYEAEDAIVAFVESTYEGPATLGGWDRRGLAAAAPQASR